MTELTIAPARPEPTPPVPPSPPARRLGRRRWRDSRLLIGVLLVLVSVVAGTRLFATADQTRQWVVAAVDLPVGHLVVESDLRTVAARLDGGTSDRYYPGSRRGDLVGATLARPVSAGELLSGADFAGAGTAATRLVPVIVKAGRLPPLSPGDHVDVFVYQPDAAGAPAEGGSGAGSAQTEPAQPAGADAGVEIQVLHDVEFVAQERLSGGDRSLSLRVAADDAIRAVAASQSGRVDVVKLERDPRGEVGSAGPATVPGYGR
ncbi:SAF domain-containing protein [Frankia sp. EI5c]|uniref:SAF domain-containing protein n=1 Tax=Frankia sp. EI5c TaxID=683316 RepID=UPI0007C32174|nr:SAF domain-containing protein [Frankia sp. EI5c]OAA19721.1 SAF domain-containing protein [Frankia sp. EI5c]